MVTAKIKYVLFQGNVEINFLIWIFYYFKLKIYYLTVEKMGKTHRNIEMISLFKHV